MKEHSPRGRHVAVPEVSGGRRALIQEEAKALRRERWSNRWTKVKDAAKVLPTSVAALTLAAAPAAAATETGGHSADIAKADSGYHLRLPEVPNDGLTTNTVPGFDTQVVVQGDTLSDLTNGHLRNKVKLTDPQRGEMLWSGTMLAAAASKIGAHPDLIFPGDNISQPNPATVQEVVLAQKGIGIPDVVEAVQALDEAVAEDYRTAGDEAQAVLDALTAAHHTPAGSDRHDEHDRDTHTDSQSSSAAPIPVYNQPGSGSIDGGGIGSLPTIDVPWGTAGKVGGGLLGFGLVAGTGELVRRMVKRDRTKSREGRYIDIDSTPEDVAERLKTNPQTPREARKDHENTRRVASEYATTDPEKMKSVYEALGQELTPVENAQIEGFAAFQNRGNSLEAGFEDTAVFGGIPSVTNEQSGQQQQELTIGGIPEKKDHEVALVVRHVRGTLGREDKYVLTTELRAKMFSLIRPRSGK